jgi:hypothetical protein
MIHPGHLAPLVVTVPVGAVSTITRFMEYNARSQDIDQVTGNVPHCAGPVRHHDAISNCLRGSQPSRDLARDGRAIGRQGPGSSFPRATRRQLETRYHPPWWHLRRLKDSIGLNTNWSFWVGQLSKLKCHECQIPVPIDPKVLQQATKIGRGNGSFDANLSGRPGVCVCPAPRERQVINASSEGSRAWVHTV